ncbi:tetratricopeptide repeat protein [Pseudomonas japonica]|uniref:Tetratricopeptide repeat-containing protein n=1 Tax=Pseudomonas japonica TaxID=256466 RepID=A0A239L4V5_9PSED|nr:tetratricopeptide repeat protein [Pseudomonas japonica]SNT24853.1 Tetratricopeptide repeat-containing protein [Pseudomonas japonica]
MLEAHEYLHLAIHASQENNHHTALDYLERALALEPDNPGVRYFQAAEYAELGLYPRAILCMTTVLELDPNMDLARFQLGLLHLQQQQTEQARAAFELLFANGTDESLRVFADAYVALIDEEQEVAIDKFERGLALCENLPLKGDMLRVLATLKPEDSPAPAEAPAAQDNAPVFLGAYRDVLETP